jgi:energy-coupling factor transporter ATP-binding protein EcfA2
VRGVRAAGATVTRGARLILTGPSGCGKTTLCRGLAEDARRAGRDVAGLLCPAIFADARKSGIAAVDLRSGETRRLARRRAAGEAAPATPRQWVFDEAVLAWGDRALGRATPCDLLVVDELGPLELDEGRGWSAGLIAVDSGAFAAAVVVVRPTLFGRARARWPSAEVADAAAPGAAARLAAGLAAVDGAR